MFERNVFLIFLRHVFSLSDNLGFVSGPPPGLVFIHSFFLEEGMRDLIFEVFHGARHGDQSRVRMPDTLPPPPVYPPHDVALTGDVPHLDPRYTMIIQSAMKVSA